MSFLLTVISWSRMTRVQAECPFFDLPKPKSSVNLKLFVGGRDGRLLRNYVNCDRARGLPIGSGDRDGGRSHGYALAAGVEECRAVIMSLSQFEEFGFVRRHRRVGGSVHVEHDELAD